MQTSYSKQQLIIRLTPEGVISEIIENTIEGLTLQTRSILMNYIDKSYHSVFLDQFKLLGDNEVLIGLSLKLISGHDVYLFMVRVNDYISSFVINSNSEIELLFDEILRMNHQQTNTIRKLSKMNNISDDNQSLFEEMMVLNNALINARRDLAVKNKELQRLNQMLKDINYIDYLTSISNRRKFFKDIYEFVVLDDVLLIMMDFNNFKMINDTYGHKRGDEALQFLASSITQKLQDLNAHVYRLGGDEFAILIIGDSTLDITEFFKKLDSEVKQFHEMSSIAYGSVLVTSETCNEKIPAEESMRVADSQMYTHKKNMKSIL